MNYKNLSLIAFIISLIVILFLALMPFSGNGTSYIGSDKINHFIAFFVLYALAIAAFPKIAYWKLFGGLAALGLLIEVLQSLPFIGRDMEKLDFIVEIIAMLLVQAVIIAESIRKSNKIF